MDKLVVAGVILPPDEYRAIWSMDEDDYDWYQLNFILFQRAMDELVMSDTNAIDPEEVNRLMSEYLEMVNRA